MCCTPFAPPAQRSSSRCILWTLMPPVLGPSPIPDHLVRLTGPLLLGYLFNWGLFGALSVQVYNYHISFPNDSRISKGVVYGVYCAELAQTLIVTRDCFTTYAAGFGNFDALNSAQTIWLSAPIMIGLISCTVQLYYAYRVYVLSRNMVLVLVICLFALLQCVGAIVQGVQLFRLGSLHDLVHKGLISCIFWLAGSAVCDIIITCSMSFLLLRRDTKVEATRNLVVRLVRLIVETGVLTSTAAMVDLIVFLSLPNETYHTALTFSLAKLYSNSLLVLFNNRSYMKTSEAIDISLSTASTGPRFRDTAPRASGAFALPSNGIHVNVQQTTFISPEDIPLEERSTTKPHSLSEAPMY